MTINKLKRGVTLSKQSRTKKFRAQIMIFGRGYNLGYYRTEDQAHEAYVTMYKEWYGNDKYRHDHYIVRARKMFGIKNPNERQRYKAKLECLREQFKQPNFPVVVDYAEAELMVAAFQDTYPQLKEFQNNTEVNNGI